MSTTAAPSTHEMIAHRAYKLWCENGRKPGSADENWRAAKRELEREREHVALSGAQDAQDAAR